MIKTRILMVAMIVSFVLGLYIIETILERYKRDKANDTNNNR